MKKECFICLLQNTCSIRAAIAGCFRQKPERPGLCGDNQDSRQPAMKFLRRDRHQQRPGA
ncbi:hypothetical protein FGF66_07285 [Chlorobaculum thiosulfatiphilum]|uniref:Uncharacterized protein n=1 Tax=Chlorobaculum thiosulfatiphilum TaxID=115852 RepID=A0A5C4S726_CHLTI|nr:hypothetical protein [Chlorobaculum thiosulfatiphilum]TNJ38779.1 hypothetical protein FGF66_07285 [Chlorobaculum thiosulfatiphilum]